MCSAGGVDRIADEDSSKRIFSSAVWGRNGECPAIVVAPSTPADASTWRLNQSGWRSKYMSRFFYLSDGYLANGAEPWAVPAINELPQIPVKFATDPTTSMPYARDEATWRDRMLCGNSGIWNIASSGIGESQHITGNVNYESLRTIT